MSTENDDPNPSATPGLLAKLECLHAIANESLFHLREVPLAVSGTDESAEWSMGRAVNVAVSIADVNVSRKHATIHYLSGDRWTIVDHKSVNGVYVNNVKCSPEEPHQLNDGDEITLAPSTVFQWRFSLVKNSEKQDRMTANDSSVRKRKDSECQVSEEPENKRTKVEENEKSDEKCDTAEESKAKENDSVIQKFKNKFNEELSCTICNEVFISPMTMPCGHVFCKFCLVQWKKQCNNRPFDCPNCRQKVQRDKLTPNFCLENLIASWTKELGPDMLAARNKAIKDREIQEEETKAIEEKKKKESNSGTSSRGRRTANGRNRQQRGIQAYLQSMPNFSLRVTPTDSEHNVQHNIAHSVEVSTTNDALPGGDETSYQLRSRGGGNEEGPITISSDSEENEDLDVDDGRNFNDSSSGDEVEGIEGSYYGGYGRCYNCGLRGHWAPGCPM